MNRKNLSAWVVTLLLLSCGPARAADTNTLHDKVAKPSPSAADETYLYDISSGSLKKTTFSALPLSTAQQSALASKAEKSLTVQDWSAWPNGSVFVANMMVAYQGQIYKCLQPYTKNSGDTPAAFTSYWSATGGGVTSYTALTDKPTIPASLADLSADSTHRVVTDAEKATWEAKQSALTAGTDYLTPNGSAANLTGFPASLATDAEVATAVSGKADNIPGTSGQVIVYNSSNVPTATSVQDLTVAEVVALFPGDGEYLKKNGTSGDPPGGVSGTAVPTKVAYDPTSSTAEGVYISTATNHQFAVYADGGVFDVTAGTYTAPPSDPCADGLLTNGCFDTDETGWTVSGAPTFTGGKATLDYGDSMSQTFTASTSGTTFFRAHLKFDALDNANSVFPVQLKSGATVVVSFEVRSTNILRINGGDLYVQTVSLAPATDYYIWGSITTGTGSATITARVGTTSVYDAATTYTAVTTATIASMPTSIVAQAVTYDTGGMIYVDSLAVSETLIGDFNE